MTDSACVPLDKIIDKIRPFLQGLDIKSEANKFEIAHLDHIRAPRPDSLTFYSGHDPEVIKALGPCTVICKPGMEAHNQAPSYILCEDPHLAFFQAAQLFFPESPEQKGIHPTAVLHKEAKVEPGAIVGPFAVLGKCTVGADCVIGAHVVIYDNTTIEAGVSIEANSCIGATGVYWAWTPKSEKLKLPQLGRTLIKEGSFLGTDVTVVRGSFSNETTTVGKNCNIAHGSKIGHSCMLGDHVHLANNISLGGTVELGAECFLGSGAIVRPGVQLAGRTVVGAGAVVVKNVSEPGTTVAGVPAKKMATGAKSSGIPNRPL